MSMNSCRRMDAFVELGVKAGSRLFSYGLAR